MNLLKRWKQSEKASEEILEKDIETASENVAAVEDEIGNDAETVSDFSEEAAPEKDMDTVEVISEKDMDSEAADSEGDALENADGEESAESGSSESEVTSCDCEKSEEKGFKAKRLVSLAKSIFQYARVHSRKIISVAAAVLTLVFVTVASFVFFVALPVRCEAGQSPDYSKITENQFVKTFCSIETDLCDIDTSVIGKKTVELKFFGFLKIKSGLIVSDTVCPEILSADVFVTKDVDVLAEMFILDVADETQVTFEIVNLPEVMDCGEYDLLIRAVDRGGNVKELSQRLTVVAPSGSEVGIEFEYGVSVEAVEKAFLSLFPTASKIFMPDEFDCGDCILRGESDGVLYYSSLRIADTKPPVAEVYSFDIALGDRVSAEDAVKNIDDHSEVEVVLESLPDFKTSGEYEVKAILTDAFGNVSEYPFFIRIHDLEREITAELGCSNADLAALIFKDDFSRNCLAFQSDRVSRGMVLGENEISLEGKYGNVTLKVTMIDTVAPDFSVHDESYLVGSKVSASDFVSAFLDASAVGFSFAAAPDSSAEGTFDVTVIATDAAGNRSEKSARVTFYYDLAAPVISGYRNYSLIAGEKCDFAYGVTAYDEICGAIDVKTDSSGVNLRVPGEYTVTYTAVDRSGNVATETVTVTVREPLYVRLDVPLIMQKPMLPNGCEATSLAMALGYNGFSISPVDLFESFMEKSPFRDGDPWTTYVGNPYVKGEGYGCFAPCVVETGNKYLESVGSSKRVCDVSGQGLSAYERLIDQGIPVLLWGTTKMSGREKICWEAEIDGKNVCWLSSSHCLLLIGYTDYTYIFCDPLEGIVEYDRAAVEYSYNLNFRQACIIK